MLTLLRADRDDFININEDNIKPGLKKNFVKRVFGTADNGVKGSVKTRNSLYNVNSEPKNCTAPCTAPCTAQCTALCTALCTLGQLWDNFGTTSGQLWDYFETT